jgi:hypothetical protein
MTGRVTARWRSCSATSGIQPIDKVFESRDFVFNSQIAIRLGCRRGDPHAAQIEIDRLDFKNLGGLPRRIDREILKAQRKGGESEVKLSFLDKFLKRQKSVLLKQG